MGHSEMKKGAYVVSTVDLKHPAPTAPLPELPAVRIGTAFTLLIQLIAVRLKEKGIRKWLSAFGAGHAVKVYKQINKEERK
jgi:hypothetical protein